MKIQPINAMMPAYKRVDLHSKKDIMAKLFEQTTYEMVKRDYRPAGTTFLPKDQNQDSFLSQLAEDGMFFYPFHKIKLNGAFVHSSAKADPKDFSASTFGCITKDFKVAKELKNLYEILYDKSKIKSEISDANKRIGELLGYPECCCEFYSKTDNYDPIYECALGGDHDFVKDGLKVLNSNPLLYKHLRYFGMWVCPWFPCSYSCKESTKQVKFWVDTMRSLNSSLADEIFGLLKDVSTWDLYNGQVLVTHKYFLGYVTSYIPKIRKVVHFGVG